MGSVDNGNQIISYDFKEAIVSEGFNKLNYQLHPIGVYYGGEFVKVSDTQIEVLPLYCLFEDSTAKATIRIETLDNAVIDVDNTKQFIVCRFQWLNTENNFMDFLALDSVDILPTDLILGRLQYTGIVLNTTYDYSKKSYVNVLYYDYFNTAQPLRVVPTFPYSDSVKVLSSNGSIIHDGKVININDTTSPSFSFPVSVNGRKDIIGIDSDTNTVVIVQGADSIGAPLPVVSSSILPVGIITFPPSTISTVKGHYITYINPYFYKTSNITDLEMFVRLKTVSGSVDGLDGDTLDTHHATYYTDKIDEIATLLGTTTILS